MLDAGPFPVSGCRPPTRAPRRYATGRSVQKLPVGQPQILVDDRLTIRLEPARPASKLHQASALRYGNPYDWDNLDQPDSVADYMRTCY